MTRRVSVLLIEDNVADQHLISEGLRAAGFAGSLEIVSDGEEAIRRLNEDFAAKNGPALILLDLNLPRKDGREVLAHVRSHPQLRSTPVVVLTTSESRQDVQRAFELGANSYFTKPADLDRFFAMMKVIASYWTELSTLPK